MNKTTPTASIRNDVARYEIPYHVVTGGKSQIRDEQMGRGQYRVYAKQPDLNAFLHVGNVHALEGLQQFLSDYFDGLPDGRREQYRVQ